MSQNEITALFDEWNAAIQTGNPKTVAALYESNGILLPTLSNNVRHNHEEIEDYFVRGRAPAPPATLHEGQGPTFGQLAINTGIYTFSFKDGTSVSARFTFVYRWNGERWMIVEHHSSQMPE